MHDASHYHRYHPKELLKKFGRSFYWAEWFLSQDAAHDAVKLYRFCRYLDDMADTDDPKQHAILRELQSSILNVQTRPNHPIINDVVLLQEKYQWSWDVIMLLMNGILQDITHQHISSDSELIQYAYHVAGTVGILMTPILGGCDDRAYSHAIDLGIAMQLTNICRDILEDAKMGRIYLPLDGLPAEEIIHAAKTPNHPIRLQIQAKLVDVLSIADQYYASGRAGIKYLKKENQRSIHVASQLYQSIGHTLMKQNCRWWKGRVVVSAWKKCWLVLKVFTRFKEASTIDGHQNVRNMYLKGFPYVQI